MRGTEVSFNTLTGDIEIKPSTPGEGVDTQAIVDIGEPMMMGDIDKNDNGDRIITALVVGAGGTPPQHEDSAQFAAVLVQAADLQEPHAMFVESALSLLIGVVGQDKQDRVARFNTAIAEEFTQTVVAYLDVALQSVDTDTISDQIFETLNSQMTTYLNRRQVGNDNVVPFPIGGAQAV